MLGLKPLLTQNFHVLGVNKIKLDDIQRRANRGRGLSSALQSSGPMDINRQLAVAAGVPRQLLHMTGSTSLLEQTLPEAEEDLQ